MPICRTPNAQLVDLLCTGASLHSVKVWRDKTMKNVQDIYPTSPMQELMLLHTLARRSTDTLLTQFVFAMDRALDAAHFEAAWAAVVERHPILRTAFVVEKVDAPLQVVRRTVKIPFTVNDWREQDDAARTQALADYCHIDREKGFDPRRAPLMRFMLIRWNETSWRFVWTSHHLLMDRWCLNEVFSDLQRAYVGLVANGSAALSAAPSFKLYVDWLAQRHHVQAHEFWRQHLHGFTTPTLLQAKGRASTHVSASRHDLDAPLCDAVHSTARAAGVTPGTVVQAALALTFAHLQRRRDILFGTAAAARPPAIANVERIVGSFVNNLPVRVKLDEQQTLGPWLKALQGIAYERSDFEYLSPLDIAACAGVPEHSVLFDTLLVWLAPTDGDLPLGLRALNNDMATAYPVTISVQEHAQTLTLHLHQRADDPAHGKNILTTLSTQLRALTRATTDQLLGDLLPNDLQPEPSAHDTAIVITGSSLADVEQLDASAVTGRETMLPELVQQLIREQFFSALGTRDIGDDDDFFAHGGDSLRAASLHTQIQIGSRKNVPLLTLFREPTIRGMTRTLTDGDWATTTGFALPLRTNGNGQPLFMVASPEVNTLGYFVLSRHLKTGLDCYVLQAPPRGDKPTPIHPDAIEPMARDYVEALRKVQPAGPYKLLGMCGGAHLSLAMMRLLKTQGQTVSFFGIVNTWSLYSVSWVYYLHRGRKVLEYYRRRLGQLFSRPTDGAEPATPPPVALANGPANEDVGLGSPWIRDVGFAHRNPGLAKLPATAHVFRLSRQQYWRINDQALGWSNFFESVNVMPLEGRYHDFLLREPHVERLAEALNLALETASPFTAKGALPLKTPTTGILS